MRDRTQLTAFFIAIAAMLVMGQSTHASPGAPNHSHDEFTAGEPGNPNQPSRIVEIIMTEEDGVSTFKPKQLTIKRNEQIHFVLRNTGKLKHEFILATPQENLRHAAVMMKNPMMEHDEENGVSLDAGQKGDFLWRFSKRGIFEYGCLIPGHREGGMIGTITVK